MTEELKQKAIEFEKKWFDKDIVISDLLIEFATEVTKELEKENAELRKVAEFGYNKANEWHYVKDGDLPKDEGTYLVYISGNLLVDRWHNGKWMLHFNTDAWKEIVLPELKE